MLGLMEYCKSYKNNVIKLVKMKSKSAKQKNRVSQIDI